jgi:ketosteroid isomerase-like protein
MRRVYLLALLALAAATLIAVRAEEKEPAKAGKAEQEVLKLEQDMIDAYVKRDPSALERIMADDYSFTAPDGMLLDKKGEIEGIKSGTVKFESMKLGDLKVRFYGATAVVTGTVDIKGKVQDHDANGTYRFTDTFTKREGRWQCVAAQATRVMKP